MRKLWSGAAAAAATVGMLTACESSTGQTPALVDLVATAEAAGEFNTLLTAVEAAGLTATLRSGGPFTVFAPTDAAFAKLGLNAGNIGGALSKEALTNVLLYHVTPGRRESGSVVTSDRIRMANGGFTQVRVTGEGAFINDAQIIGVDVAASNGIIHIIDSVLLP